MLNYSEILKKCKDYYFKYIKKGNIVKVPDEFVIMQFYDLVLNILNQEPFDYVYSFKVEDIKFIEKYKLNLSEVINNFKVYI